MFILALSCELKRTYEQGELEVALFLLLDDFEFTIFEGAKMGPVRRLTPKQVLPARGDPARGASLDGLLQPAVPSPVRVILELYLRCQPTSLHRASTRAASPSPMLPSRRESPSARLGLIIISRLGQISLPTISRMCTR